jgi:hypothetical protein
VQLVDSPERSEPAVLCHERIDRALLLMMLDSNGFANEARYARAIHDWLLAGARRPRLPRRAIADLTGYASLRP